MLVKSLAGEEGGEDVALRFWAPPLARRRSSLSEPCFLRDASRRPAAAVPGLAEGLPVLCFLSKRSVV